MTRGCTRRPSLWALDDRPLKLLASESAPEELPVEERAGVDSVRGLLAVFRVRYP